MHIGLDLGERWLRATRLSGTHQVPCAIPDFRNNHQLATRLSFQIDGELVLGGDAIEVLERERPLDFVIKDFRSRLTEQTCLLIDGAGRKWFAEGLVGLCWEKMRRDVQAVTEAPWTSATMTIPTGATDEYKTCFHRAAKLAGLSKYLLLDEALATWYFVNASSTVPSLSLVLQIGYGFTSISLVTGKFHEARVTSYEILPQASMDQVEMAVANELIRQLPLSLTSDAACSKTVLQETRRAVQAHGIQPPNLIPSIERHAFLIGGQVQEVVLQRQMWLSAWSNIWNKLPAAIDRVLNDANTSAANISQVILAGPGAAGVSLAHVANHLPQAKIWHDTELAAWIPAYGAAMVGPASPIWGLDCAVNSTKSAMVGQDIGLLVLNPTTQQPEVDILVPTGTLAPFRTARRYQSNTSKHMFKIVLVSMINPSDFEILMTLEVPLTSSRTACEIEVICEFQGNDCLDVTAIGDVESTSPLRYHIPLNQTVLGRMAAQRTLLSKVRFC